LGRHRAVVGGLIAALAVACATACSSILGFGDFAIGGPDAGLPTDGPAPGAEGGSDGGSEASCDVDLTAVCYACAPTETDQFLNSCTTGQCLTFDHARLTSLLLPDGGLPSFDGGVN
jgi:hypothetical protein